MLRIVLILSLVLCLPALAADWSSYTNHRFGYALAVPADFAGQDLANADLSGAGPLIGDREHVFGSNHAG